MSELKISVLILRENMLYSGEFYTAGKNLILPPAAAGLVHNCTIFLCSLDVRNIVQGGDPLYAAVNHKQGCGGYT